MSTPPAPSGDDDPNMADADWLLRDVPTGPSETAPSKPRVVDEEELYTVEGVEESVTESESVPLAPPIAFAPARPAKAKAKVQKPTREEVDPDEAVEQVWTRWGEWGPNLIVVGLAFLASASLFFVALSAGSWQLAFLFFLLGAAATLMLSYPMFITLERPVRITPEQAVRDYFGALSHHLPHYRRMWLLLSASGQDSERFQTFEGFKFYWTRTLARLQGEPASKFNLLRFQVENFRAEPSARKTVADAQYTLHVFLGDPAGEPRAAYLMETTIVKGPDKMWYLARGTLPD